MLQVVPIFRESETLAADVAGTYLLLEELSPNHLDSSAALVAPLSSIAVRVTGCTWRCPRYLCSRCWYSGGRVV